VGKTSTAGKGKILLIEDDISLSSIYADVLKADGYKVLIAEDGEQGLAMIRTEKPDVVLLDLILPKLPGFEVLKSVRADAGIRKTIILIMSVMGEQRHIQKAMELGADDYEVKGSHTTNYVLEKIQSLLKPAVEEDIKAYKLFVKGDRGDMSELEKDTGVIKLLICKSCREEMQLVLTPDNSRAGAHYFSAHFACPKCGKLF
jgi:DNA-binding response OmpR family regulator